MDWLLISLLFLRPCTVDHDAYARRLAADDWRARERATQQLIRCGTGALPVLDRLQRHSDCEVRCRARQAREAVMGSRLASLGEFPFIDSFYYDRLGRRYRYLDDDCQWHVVTYRYFARYQGLEWDEKTPFYNYRLATRDWAADCVEAGIPVWMLKALFWELRKRDEAYLRSCGRLK